MKKPPFIPHPDFPHIETAGRAFSAAANKRCDLELRIERLQRELVAAQEKEDAAHEVLRKTQADYPAEKERRDAYIADSPLRINRLIAPQPSAIAA